MSFCLWVTRFNAIRSLLVWLTPGQSAVGCLGVVFAVQIRRLLLQCFVSSTFEDCYVFANCNVRILFRTTSFASENSPLWLSSHLTGNVPTSFTSFTSFILFTSFTTPALASYHQYSNLLTVLFPYHLIQSSCHCQFISSQAFLHRSPRSSHSQHLGSPIIIDNLHQGHNTFLQHRVKW